MPRKARNTRTLLLTGVPGIGKTTLIRTLATNLGELRIRGFVTDEIRIKGRRAGFRLETFDGQRAVLAHTNIRSRHRVGKYGVDVEALDRVIDAALQPDDQTDLYLIDEIGRMECFSQRFMDALTQLLASDRTVVATIHRNAPGFIQRVKERPDVELWEVTLQNRDELCRSILAWLERP
jgi:nucleoside-triphosphatase